MDVCLNVLRYDTFSRARTKQLGQRFGFVPARSSYYEHTPAGHATAAAEAAAAAAAAAAAEAAVGAGAADEAAAADAAADAADADADAAADAAATAAAAYPAPADAVEEVDFGRGGAPEMEDAGEPSPTPAERVPRKRTADEAMGDMWDCILEAKRRGVSEEYVVSHLDRCKQSLGRVIARHGQGFASQNPVAPLVAPSDAVPGNSRLRLKPSGDTRKGVRPPKPSKPSKPTLFTPVPGIQPVPKKKKPLPPLSPAEHAAGKRAKQLLHAQRQWPEQQRRILDESQGAGAGAAEPRGDEEARGE